MTKAYTALPAKDTVNTHFIVFIYTSPRFRSDTLSKRLGQSGPAGPFSKSISELIYVNKLRPKTLEVEQRSSIIDT